MLEIMKKAFVRCNGGTANISCSYGCVGCGACEATCKTGAITVKYEGVAVVDPDKCQGCGECVEVCPREVIVLRREDAPFVVRCSNPEPGIQAKKSCNNSCIACGSCVRNCPADAITLTDNYPVIDGDKCLACGMCLVNCPRKVFVDARGIIKA